jgi:hypothetical protein
MTTSKVRSLAIKYALLNRSSSSFTLPSILIREADEIASYIAHGDITKNVEVKK